MQKVAAEQLECTEEQLEQQFVELVALLPGIRERMRTIKADKFVSLARDPAQIAERLIQLKAIFPQANVEQMVLRDFNLVLAISVEQIAEAAQELREMLPSTVHIDRQASLNLSSALQSRSTSTKRVLCERKVLTCLCFIGVTAGSKMPLSLSTVA